jgi:dihydroorotase-like cyclic amidohydrolase
MWEAVADGRIDYIASDHAPSTKTQKQNGSIWDVHFGLPGLDTTFAVLLDGAARGLLPYERVAEVYSEAPARIFGLRGKGRLEPGADGDVVLVDPNEHWTVSDADVISKAGWSPFSGRRLRGRALTSFLRGVPLLRDGEVVGKPGAGRFLPGAGAGSPGPEAAPRCRPVRRAG